MARVSQRVVREKGFGFVAVEGEWPDFDRVDPAAGRRARGAYFRKKRDARRAADAKRDEA